MIVTCLDDNFRPAEIPLSKWIKRGVSYTAIRRIKCNTQGGIEGFVLAEIDLTGCEPYKCFSIHRFGIPLEQKDNILKEELELELI